MVSENVSLSVLEENGKTRLEFDVEGTVATFRPVGVLDEDVNFSVLMQALANSQPRVTELRIDTGEVSRINSCGVREWLLLMERIPSDISFVFVNVGELFVAQASMVPGVFGRRGAKILSFNIGFHCDACKKDFTQLIECSSMDRQGEQPRLPGTRCPSCSQPAESDLLEQEFAAFLKSCS